MSDTLHDLMETGRLPPLSCYFARFVARGSGAPADGLLAQSAALVSMRNLRGDVCVDLRHWAGRPLFDSGDNNAAGLPRGPALDDWLRALRDSEWVSGPGARAPLILDGERLYLGKYWHFEQRIAGALRGRLEPVRGLDRARLAEGLMRLFPDSGSPDIDWQKVAAAIAASRRFAVISGGPGTGKTTTVVKLLALLLEPSPSLRIALAAPTGKAAARLSEAIRSGKGRVNTEPEILAKIPEEASTLHRLLGVGFDHGFRHGPDNPLLVDCLVVDEASMIDVPLMARLLEALPDAARLILLGDRDQLASVEAGSVLGDITGHGREILCSGEQARFLKQVSAAPEGRLPSSGHPAPAADAVGLLRVSYRFGPDSGIGALARTVNAGQGAAAMDLLRGQRFPDIGWLEAGDERLHPACIDWAVERYARCLREQEVVAALRAFEQARVLAALHRGPFGVGELNRRIAEQLQARGLIAGGEEYHGKPVMVTANDYEVGLFNGDIGLLWRDESGVTRAYFPLGEDRARSVSVRQLPAHTRAYALTVHKSQGSEFDEVLLVLPFEPGPVVTRELIYTGVTRAKRAVTIQGGHRSFLEGCRNRVQRTSGLAEKLGWNEAD